VSASASIRWAAQPSGTEAIAERHGLDITVVNSGSGPTFRFMTLDHDGKIRMDQARAPGPWRDSVALKDRFDVAGATTRMRSPRHRDALASWANHLAVAIAYLLRTAWLAEGCAVGKTLVSSSLIDRVVGSLGGRIRRSVGFKWFVEGLLDGSIAFGGEETRARASPQGRDRVDHGQGRSDPRPALGGDRGTDRKDRRACPRSDGAVRTPCYTRIDTPATPAEKESLKRLSPEDVKETTLAGDPITATFTRAPGNGAAIGGLKVVSEGGWFAARPSGTENIYKLYAESFRDSAHLAAIVDQARGIVRRSLATR
jgi:phosphoglucomutase